MLHQCLVSVKKPFIKMVPVPQPMCISGRGKVNDIAKICKELGVTKPCIVTDHVLMKLGLLHSLLQTLDEANIGYSIFDDITPDPDYGTVRRGVTHYQSHGCDSVIAFGGGSPMDCAKALAASVKTNKDVAKLPGLLKVHRRLMPIIAIPTTAGTGSECTVAAVVSDVKARKKRSITDPFLVPKVAILDPNLMLGLPAQVTAETGADALTHAIESYLSGYANTQTRQWSVSAIKRIFSALPTAYQDGNNSHAREQMALASFEAGLAFTRTYIGYVHAIAHQLGAFYHVPHGRANAIVLPLVLEGIQQRDNARLTQLAVELGYKDSVQGSASSQFTDAVKALLERVAIPKVVKELQVEDIPRIAQQAIKEAFGEYPVPEVMSLEECQRLLKKLIELGVE
ncbi:iron-containing alcohol dehydrogenase [Vibrio methylphosphonaticus]|uniref:iron-containing alcohol dehydrogenase n=1 Tax=Vibrio methylphosphonaticus TaxID=2946866 RepID=UPI002029C431|nr:iron-containing alcohol dehydrogenase [Vibrio methylphosphonaticus]MCL9776101.1 iron-containing alcohol dehydrogenase [Vibrio methylphosphonaticus]